MEHRQWLRKGKSCLAIGRECAEKQKAKHTIKHLSIIYTYVHICTYIDAVGSPGVRACSNHWKLLSGLLWAIVVALPHEDPHDYDALVADFLLLTFNCPRAQLVAVKFLFYTVHTLFKMYGNLGNA